MPENAKTPKQQPPPQEPPAAPAPEPVQELPIMPPAPPVPTVRFEQFNIDQLCLGAGGHFIATSMMQKRLRDLVRNNSDFNKADNKTLILQVLDEIRHDSLEFEKANITLIPQFVDSDSMDSDAGGE